MRNRSSGHVHLIAIFLLLVLIAIVYQLMDWHRKVSYLHSQTVVLTDKLGRLEDRLNLLELRYTSLSRELNPEVKSRTLNPEIKEP